MASQDHYASYHNIVERKDKLRSMIDSGQNILDEINNSDDITIYKQWINKFIKKASKLSASLDSDLIDEFPGYIEKVNSFDNMIEELSRLEEENEKLQNDLKEANQTSGGHNSMGRWPSYLPDFSNHDFHNQSWDDSFSDAKGYDGKNGKSMKKSDSNDTINKEREKMKAILEQKEKEVEALQEKYFKQRALAEQFVDQMTEEKILKQQYQTQLQAVQSEMRSLNIKQQSSVERIELLEQENTDLTQQVSKLEEDTSVETQKRKSIASVKMSEDKKLHDKLAYYKKYSEKQKAESEKQKKKCKDFEKELKEKQDLIDNFARLQQEFDTLHKQLEDTRKRLVDEQTLKNMLAKKVEKQDADSSFIGNNNGHMQIKAVVNAEFKTVTVVLPENPETGEKRRPLHQKIEIVNADDLNISTLDTSQMDNSFIGNNGVVNMRKMGIKRSTSIFNGKDKDNSYNDRRQMQRLARQETSQNEVFEMNDQDGQLQELQPLQPKKNNHARAVSFSPMINELQHFDEKQQNFDENLDQFGDTQLKQSKTVLDKKRSQFC